LMPAYSFLTSTWPSAMLGTGHAASILSADAGPVSCTTAACAGARAHQPARRRARDRGRCAQRRAAPPRRRAGRRTFIVLGTPEKARIEPGTRLAAWCAAALAKCSWRLEAARTKLNIAAHRRGQRRSPQVCARATSECTHPHTHHARTRPRSHSRAHTPGREIAAGRGRCNTEEAAEQAQTGDAEAGKGVEEKPCVNRGGR